MLRRRQIGGFRFRRQFPIGPYFADFYCPVARIAVEVDGSSHLRRAKKDWRRDSHFLSLGIGVVRVSNKLAMTRPETALTLILTALHDATSPLTK